MNCLCMACYFFTMRKIKWKRNITLTLKHQQINYRAGDAKFSHLAETEVQKVIDASKNALTWLENARQALAHTPRHQQPSHTTHQIRQERQVTPFIISVVLDRQGIS